VVNKLRNKTQMKRSIILFIALFIPLIVFSQDIDYAEYFIDTDPGFGTAAPIAVSAAGNDISLDFSADIASLQQGLHFLVVRARDDQGQWSQGANTIFYLVKSSEAIISDIDLAEYFIDTDPGFGNAISIPVPTPGADLTLQLTPGLESLDQGMHYIHFRARDMSGRWGTAILRVFLVAVLPSSADSDIQLVEYFIDTDPGYGMGTPLTIPSSGNDLTIDFTASLSGLADGNHMLYIRAKNELNKWGQVFAEGFAYSATGIGDEEINSLFKIFPNPSSGIIQVEVSEQIRGEFKIRLMDLNGKVVYTCDCYNRQCEVHFNLPVGMYLLNIESSECSITQKIILE